LILGPSLQVDLEESVPIFKIEMGTFLKINYRERFAEVAVGSGLWITPRSSSRWGQDPRVQSVGPPPELQQRPFTREQAHAAGISVKQLRSQRFRRLFRGVYADAELPDTLELRCQALMLLLPTDAIFSHFTAAQLYGLPAECEVIHVSASSPTTRPAPRARLQFHESVPMAHRRNYRGFPLATPERTFVDLANLLDLVDLVILGDAMLRRRLASWESLREAVAAAARRRGVRVARQALPLLRDGVDSPMETRLRLLLVSAGLPCPEVNVDIFDEHGHWFSRPDLVYRAPRLAMEYEGDTHRTDKRQWRADMTRHEVLHDLGWTVLRFHADDILARPKRTAERVRYWLNLATSHKVDLEESAHFDLENGRFPQDQL
jgi:Protein of unknown function (DUF559)